MPEVNSSDHLAIKNILSRYCDALDSKNFELLQSVFLHDVVADYPFSSDPFQGVEAVSKAIQNRYAYEPSCGEHLLSSTIASDPFERTIASRRNRSFSIRMVRAQMRQHTSLASTSGRDRMKGR
jgi:hypothetical protein